MFQVEVAPKREFICFATLFDASMINKDYKGKEIFFELSTGIVHYTSYKRTCYPCTSEHFINHVMPSCGSRGGGPRGPWPPPSLLKLVIKKMAAIGGPLYFMFLAPPPPPSSDHPGSDADAFAIFTSASDIY